MRGRERKTALAARVEIDRRVKNGDGRLQLRRRAVDHAAGAQRACAARLASNPRPRLPRLTFCARALPAVFARLDSFLPQMRAANEKMERETAADPESANIECLSDPEAPHIAMDLACGLLEVKPADEHAAADSDDDDDDGAPLQLPSQQTRAVADAVKAGRTLISEVAEGAEGGEDGDPPPPAGWKRKSDADDGDDASSAEFEGGTSEAAQARPARRARRGGGAS